jgi:hypothetical protein
MSRYALTRQRSIVYPRKLKTRRVIYFNLR